MEDQHVPGRVSPGQFGGPENVGRLRPNWLGRLLILIPFGLVVGGGYAVYRGITHAFLRELDLAGTRAAQLEREERAAAGLGGDDVLVGDLHL